MQGYPERIRDVIATTQWKDADPRLVECWIRLAHGTLDGMSQGQFAAEAITGAQLTIENPDASVALAATYGVAL